MKRILTAAAAIIMLACSFAGVFAAPAEFESFSRFALTERQAAARTPAKAAFIEARGLEPMPKEALFAAVLSVPYGGGEWEIAADKSSFESAPQDFLIREDGSAAILDSASGSIKLYGKNGFEGSISIPFIGYPEQMAESESAFYVSGESGELLKIEKTESGESRYSQLRCGGSYILCSDGSSVWLSMEDGEAVAVEGKAPEPSEFENAIGSWPGGGFYSERYEEIDGPVQLGEYLVIKHGADGKANGYAGLRIEDYELPTKRRCRVSSDGSLYCMACIDGCVDLFKVIPGTHYSPRMDELYKRADEILGNSIHLTEREAPSHGEGAFGKAAILCETIPSYDASAVQRAGFIPNGHSLNVEKIFLRVILQAPG